MIASLPFFANGSSICPELAADERFKTASGRALNRAALIPPMAERFRTNTRQHWMSACLKMGVRRAGENGAGGL